MPAHDRRIAPAHLASNHKHSERPTAKHRIVARGGRPKKVAATLLDLSAPPLPGRMGRGVAAAAAGKRTRGDITDIQTAGSASRAPSTSRVAGSPRCIGRAHDPDARRRCVRDGGVRTRRRPWDDLPPQPRKPMRSADFPARRVLTAADASDPPDNAVAQSFQKTRGREVVACGRLRTRAEARQAIASGPGIHSVEQHASLGDVPPLGREQGLGLAARQAAESAIWLELEGRGRHLADQSLERVDAPIRWRSQD